MTKEAPKRYEQTQQQMFAETLGRLEAMGREGDNHAELLRRKAAKKITALPDANPSSIHGIRFTPTDKKILTGAHAETLAARERSVRGLAGYLVKEKIVTESVVGTDGKIDIEALSQNEYFADKQHLLEALKEFQFSQKGKMMKKVVEKPRKEFEKNHVTKIRGIGETGDLTFISASGTPGGTMPDGREKPLYHVAAADNKVTEVSFGEKVTVGEGMTYEEWLVTDDGRKFGWSGNYYDVTASKVRFHNDAEGENNEKRGIARKALAVTGLAGEAVASVVSLSNGFSRIAAASEEPVQQARTAIYGQAPAAEVSNVDTAALQSTLNQARQTALDTASRQSSGSEAGTTPTTRAVAIQASETTTPATIASTRRTAPEPAAIPASAPEAVTPAATTADATPAPVVPDVPTRDEILDEIRPEILSDLNEWGIEFRNNTYANNPLVSDELEGQLDNVLFGIHDSVNVGLGGTLGSEPDGGAGSQEGNGQSPSHGQDGHVCTPHCPHNTTTTTTTPDYGSTTTTTIKHGTTTSTTIKPGTTTTSTTIKHGTTTTTAPDIDTTTTTAPTTTTLPAPTTTRPAPTTTVPAPTTTLPAPTTTEAPRPTTTLPATTTTTEATTPTSIFKKIIQKVVPQRPAAVAEEAQTGELARTGGVIETAVWLGAGAITGGDVLKRASRFKFRRKNKVTTES